MGRAEYQDVLNGGLKLIPPSNRLDALAEDCRLIKDILLGRIPAFDKIMSGLQLLQEELRNMMPKYEECRIILVSLAVHNVY